MHYDAWLRMKGMNEEIFIKAARAYGTLLDYLPGSTVDYWVDDFEEVERWAADGYENWRDDFTAEELFIRAHETAKEARVTW